MQLKMTDPFWLLMKVIFNHCLLVTGISGINHLRLSRYWKIIDLGSDMLSEVIKRTEPQYQYDIDLRETELSLGQGSWSP